MNGDLLARSEIAITGTFRLLCCAVSEVSIFSVLCTPNSTHTVTCRHAHLRTFACYVSSQMFEWDKDNVIITGSSDGIVRVSKAEYE